MHDESKIHFIRQPDPLERNVRLVCGALLGLFASFCFWLQLEPSVPIGLVASLAIIGCCAFCALKYGDDFWYWALGALR